MKQAEKKKISYITATIKAFLIFAITFLIIFFQCFYTWDNMTFDFISQKESVANKQIYILAIDQKTLEKYGTFTDWSRDVSRQIVQKLNQDKKKAPAVIAFDVLFMEDTKEEEDRSFADACKAAGNVVTAANLQFKELPETDENGRIIYNPFHVDNVDLPYDSLKQAVDWGYANTIVDDDGCVRRSIAQVEYNGETFSSLAMKVYETYQSAQGEKVVMPKLDKYGQFYFQYTSKSGGYSVISLCDLLDGTVDASIFQNSIVLVGAYVAGMQDSYIPAISHGQQMYGVEIHANVIEALLEGKTKQQVPLFWVAFVSGIVTMSYYVFTRKCKLGILTLISSSLIVSYGLLVKVIYTAGYILPVLYVPVVLCALYLIQVLREYVKETKRRRKVIGVLKHYIAPQVVEELSKKKDFQLELGGEKRNIAVLFVDIRDFTTLSERLQPEEVVEILNAYLALVTDSIFHNSGTLDKFIGDAAMAVFNAPLDLDDYIYQAVKAAWDMKAGSKVLAEQFAKRFGRSVEFGIGVHCGNAVVGNIGCEFRMDYTAIGDTVNTACRLESTAKRGQILISKEVYEAVKDRVVVTPIGDLPLKGKEKGVIAYQVDELI